METDQSAAILRYHAQESRVFDHSNDSVVVARALLTSSADDIDRLRARVAELEGALRELLVEVEDTEEHGPDCPGCRAQSNARAVLGRARCPGGGYNGQPADQEPTVEACLTAGVCGCDFGDAIGGKPR